MFLDFVSHFSLYCVGFLYLVPILGPWSFMVPYFVGRFARGFLYLVPILGPWSFMVPYFVGSFARGFLYLVPY